MSRASSKVQSARTCDFVKLTDPARGRRGLQPQRDGRVRCSARQAMYSSSELQIEAEEKGNQAPGDDRKLEARVIIVALVKESVNA